MMIGNIHPKSQSEEQTRQTALVKSNLLVFSPTILHVYCRNTRWRKPQATYCLRQQTHLVVLFLVQLQSLIPAAYYREGAATSQIETYSTSNSIMVLSLLFLTWTRTQVFWRAFEIWFYLRSWQKHRSHHVFCATLFPALSLWNLRSSCGIYRQSFPKFHRRLF